MIKKQLLSMKRLEATDRMMRMVQQDKGRKYTREYWRHTETYYLYDHYQYYRAIVQNGILKIAVFERKKMAAGIRTPEFEIYIDKHEGKWLTYNGYGWKTAKIDNLPYDTDRGVCNGNYPWASKETTEIVNNYLESSNLQVRTAILNYQNQKLKERVKKKNRNILERIDGIMACVPAPPKDFDQWVIDSAFSKEKCIFYDYKTKEGYCTACESNVKLKIKPYHNLEGRCPHCKKEVTLKAWKKQKTIESWKWTGLLQKLSDKSGYVLRIFHCKIRRSLKVDWKMEGGGCWERYRIILDMDFNKREWFKFGEYKNTRIDRWNRGEDIRKPFRGCYYQDINDECILYHRNIKKLRKNTSLRYIPWEKMLTKEQGNYCKPTLNIKRMKRYPKLEYFIHMKLYRLANDILNQSYGQIEGIDFTKKKPNEVLGIPADQIRTCIHMNISLRELHILQEAVQRGIRLEEAQIRYLTDALSQQQAHRIFLYGHIQRMIRYFKEDLKGQPRQIGDYLDYLEDLEVLGIPIGKSEMFPKNFQTVHLQVSTQRQERDNRIRHMELEEKNRQFLEMLPQVRAMYEMSDETFAIVFPTCKEDFQVEGRRNHNCVGGSYFDKMLREESVVFFLRKKENIDEAYCTVEMQGSRILQCRAIRNSMAPPEAMKFMEKVAKEVEKRILKSRIQIAV